MRNIRAMNMAHGAPMAQVVERQSSTRKGRVQSPLRSIICLPGIKARAQKCADAATRVFITQTAGEVQLAGAAGDCT